MRTRMKRAEHGLLVAALAGGIGLAVTGTAFGRTVNASTSSTALPPVVVMGTAPASGHRAEPHPEIRAAIRALENARAHLHDAAHDFGGHRVEAIAAIDAALNQLHLALQYDR